MLSNDELLPFLTKLHLDDKISLIFLLADDPSSSHYTIQQLKDSSSATDEEGIFKQFLLQFIISNPYAKQAFIEAINLLQNVRILRLLGISRTKIESGHINEVRKHLYKLADSLTEEQTCKLVQKVTGTVVTECRHLEEVILDWQLKGILTVGSDSTSSLESITSFFDVTNTPDYDHHSNLVPEEFYPIYNPLELGYCIIINNSTFTKNQELPHLMPSEELPPRPGSEHDVELVKNVFSSLHFKTFPHENVNYNELKTLLTKYADMVQKSHSFFTMIVMSHGTEDVVYTADSVPVRVEALEMSFQRNNCPNLSGTPKIFIIQACQGEQVQRVEVDGLFPKEKPKIDVTGMGPERGDALIAWSTVKGYASFRDRLEGSWFIQELCQELMKEAARKGLVDIITTVNLKLRRKTCHGACMVPSLTSSLCKKIKFVSN